MNGRSPTVAEKKWMMEAVELGCVVCAKSGMEGTPAEIHHINGSKRMGCHFLTIPLCYRHHRVSGKGWVSRHGDGRKAFEREYGGELELLEWCKNAVG